MLEEKAGTGEDSQHFLGEEEIRHGTHSQAT